MIGMLTKVRWISIIAVMSLSVGLHQPAHGGENWPSYRGPTDQGHSDATRLPLQWSETQNVAWKTPLPGKAWSSPVIWGSRVWLINATADGKELFVLSIDKGSGKILSNKLVRRVEQPQQNIPSNSFASPSPVIEEGRLYVSFGSPYNACFDTATGAVLWERTDFVCNHYRGPGSSPYLVGDLLLLHFDGSDRQYIVALNKRTGKTVWQTDRSMDFHDTDPKTGKPVAEGDFHKAFSTPILTPVNGKPLLLSLGSMALYAYEPATGKEVWRVESRGSHSGSARPVTGFGLVFTPIAYTSDIWAIRPDGQGVVTTSHVAWKHPRGTPWRSSPLLVGEFLYVVDIAGKAACLEATTGKERWRERLGGTFSASPIDAAGRLYFFDERGKATVLEAAPEYKLLATNQLDDGFMASPAVSGNALYLRTKTALYRIEDRQTTPSP